MDFSGFLVLGAAWFLLNLLSNSRRKTQQPGLSTPPPEPPRRVTFDRTQQEGRRLDLLLRDFQQNLEAANRTAAAKEGESLESLDPETDAQSSERELRRAGRVEVDQDDLAEQVVARRISAAEARDTPAGKTERSRPKQEIRAEVADKTAVQGYTVKQLRDAVVWGEILGPPVGLRDE
jgi:hypothetical protein